MNKLMPLAHCISVAALMLCVLVGCRQTPQPSAPQAAPSPQRAAAIREQLMQQAPNMLIGDVVEVYPQAQLAAVSNAAVERFHDGDVVTFLNAEKEPVATGQVVRIVGDQLHIRYEPAQNGRPPQQGDLAVRIPSQTI
jgi:hypothetical protein